ncbi:MAG: tetratricopeptide repeat protein [Candidatus Methylomirabilis sp.]
MTPRERSVLWIVGLLVATGCAGTDVPGIYSRQDPNHPFIRCTKLTGEAGIAACQEYMRRPEPKWSWPGSLGQGYSELETLHRTTALHRLGDLLLDGGRDSEAIHAYQEARLKYDLLSNPIRLRGRSQVNSGIAVALGRLGRSEEALALAQQATRENPDSARAWATVGVLANTTGQYQESVDAFERAWALDQTIFHQAPALRPIWEASRAGRRLQ